VRRAREWGTVSGEQRPTLGQFLHAHRQRRGLSQGELAHLTTPVLSVSTIGNAERGRVRPYRHTLEALADALALGAAARAELLAAWRTAGGADPEPAPPAASAGPFLTGGDHAAVPAAPVAPPTHRHNLPAQVTSFVGRARELARLTALLIPGHAAHTPTREVHAPRLITLVGPPGTGKTRLAARTADALTGAFDGRVAFVSLASVADPTQVAATIADALGIPETGGAPPVSALKEHLRGDPALLVLDNFEQVVASAPLVVDLVAACPRLRVLATSREALRVSGEQLFPVPPLTLPDRARPASADELLRYEAMALFVERARASDPAFELDDANARAVVELCHRLDGLPLAIELAAGRVGTLPPAALLARWDAGALSGGLALLAGGPRDRPARQQTLWAAIAWSHDLLACDEQAVFRRLGVFEGGFTLEAAEAVCGGVPMGAVEGVLALAARSLVQQVAGGAEPRFALLETLRAYALERLTAAGEEERVRAAHAAWLVEFAERGERALYTPERDAWVERTARENDNLRSALRWLVGRDDCASVALAQRILTSLSQLSVLALVPECRVWAERLAARPEPPGPVRARFLANAYLFALFQGDLDRVRSWVADAVDTARAAGEPRPLADALFAAGHFHQLLGRHAEAIPLLQESAGLYRPIPDEEGRKGMALLGLGVSQAGDDPAAADALLAEGLELYQRRGSWFGLGLAHTALGKAAAIRGDAATACAHHVASLRLSHEHGDRWTSAYVLSSMMPALAELDDPGTALPLIEELLSAASDLGLPSYARGALALLERLLPADSRDGPAAALYARCAELVPPAPPGSN
jgi:predicted ATPase/transcriptional regulator with XRE-family HTH domain